FSNGPSAAIGLAKIDPATQATVILGDFDLTSRVYIPRTLAPGQEAMVGILVVSVNLYNCDCMESFIIRDGDSVILETDQGLIKAVFPRMVLAEFDRKMILVA